MSPRPGGVTWGPYRRGCRGRSVASILEAYERRLANGADAERAAAVDEIAAIMRLRLETAP